jgi:hypothetical protein
MKIVASLCLKKNKKNSSTCLFGLAMTGMEGFYFNKLNPDLL